MKRLLFTLIIFLSACSPSSLSLYGPTLGEYNFSYDVESPKKAGVIQVFDDGKDTYFKLLRDDGEVAALSFYESDSSVELLEASSVHRNLIKVSGLHEAISVRSGKGTTYVTKAIYDVKRDTGCESVQDCQL